MDINCLSKDVIEAVRQNLGCDDPDDESRDEQISQMGPMEVFDLYLIWEGVIGYSHQIWNAVESIKMATAKEEVTQPEKSRKASIEMALQIAYEYDQWGPEIVSNMLDGYWFNREVPPCTYDVLMGLTSIASKMKSEGRSFTETEKLMMNRRR